MYPVQENSQRIQYKQMQLVKNKTTQKVEHCTITICERPANSLPGCETTNGSTLMSTEMISYLHLHHLHRWMSVQIDACACQWKL